jgi:hypothetical protein
MMVTPQVVNQEEEELLGIREGAVAGGAIYNDGKLQQQFTQQQSRPLTNIVTNNSLNFTINKSGGGKSSKLSGQVEPLEKSKSSGEGVVNRLSGIKEGRFVPTPQSDAPPTKSGGTLYLEGGKFEQNTTAGNGGAIYNALPATPQEVAKDMDQKLVAHGQTVYDGRLSGSGAMIKEPEKPVVTGKSNVSVGLNGPMDFSADLSVPFNQSTVAVPQFGGYQAPRSESKPEPQWQGGVAGGVVSSLRDVDTASVSSEARSSGRRSQGEAIDSNRAWSFGGEIVGGTLDEKAPDTSAIAAQPASGTTGPGSGKGVADGSSPGATAEFGPILDLIEAVVSPDSGDVKKELSTRTASLDIEIPYTGREFLFTTPQGTLELSARCFAVETSSRALTFLAALVGLGGVYGLFCLCTIIGRRMTFDRRTHRNVAGLVTLLGCLALPLSVVVFVTAMIVAVVLWVLLLKRKLPSP